MESSGRWRAELEGLQQGGYAPATELQATGRPGEPWTRTWTRLAGTRDSGPPKLWANLVSHKEKSSPLRVLFSDMKLEVKDAKRRGQRPQVHPMNPQGLKLRVERQHGPGRRLKALPLTRVSRGWPSRKQTSKYKSRELIVNCAHCRGPCQVGRSEAQSSVSGGCPTGLNDLWMILDALLKRFLCQGNS